jgi:RNA polymerase sigma factor (TIGR02999 family)
MIIAMSKETLPPESGWQRGLQQELPVCQHFLKNFSSRGMLSGHGRCNRILAAIEQGDPSASEQLLPLVYEELRALAAQRLAHEKPGQTLQATALVHDAYLRLVDVEQAQKWNSRGHFFSAAAEAMRRLLVEKARRKKRVRHGGGRRRVDLDTELFISNEANDSMIALDEALGRLAAEEPAAAEVVKLRYFAGLTIEQTAAALNISVRTVNRHWTYARAWLYEQLN